LAENRNMQKDYKSELLKYIASSDLDDDQKELWSLFAKISMPLEDEAVFEAVSQDNESLAVLTEHLRDKIWDMKENNKKAWEKLSAGYAGKVNEY
jgi:hypothetical protein